MALGGPWWLWFKRQTKERNDLICSYSFWKSTCTVLTNHFTRSAHMPQEAPATPCSYGGADSPCPAWLSAPTKSPSEFLHTVVSLSRRWTFPGGTLHNTKNLYQLRQTSRQQRRQTAVAVTGWLDEWIVSLMHGEVMRKTGDAHLTTRSTFGLSSA